MNPTATHKPDGEKYDVAVIGGGPAGAALATFLARKGWSCAIFEKTPFPRYHIGESLIPDTYGVLDRLGLLPTLKDSNYPVKHGVRFIPDDDALVVCVGLSPARTLAVLDALGDAGSLVLARDTGHALRLLGHSEPAAAPPSRAAAEPAPGARVHRLGALTVDEGTRRVTWAGSPIALSVKEFDLLCVLVEQPGRVHTFADLTRRALTRKID